MTAQNTELDHILAELVRPVPPEEHQEIREAKRLLLAWRDRAVEEIMRDVKHTVFTGAPFASKNAEYQAEAIFNLIEQARLKQTGDNT